MAFRSILFSRGDDRERVRNSAEPGFFVDLNLDQLVDHVVAGKDEYDLKLFFHVPLRDAEAVAYRHAVMRDLEKPDVHAAVTHFADEMLEVRKCLKTVEKLHYRRQKQRWFLDAVDAYCQAVGRLAADLDELDIRSDGLRSFRDYLRHHVGSHGYKKLAEEIGRRKEELAQIRYAILVGNGSVTVRLYQGEEDYTKQIEETFAKFRQGAPKSYLVKFPEFAEMNHIEAGIVEHVADLEPDVFARLDAFCQAHRDFEPPEIAGFDREIQVYLCWLDFTARIGKAALPFCYPELATDDKRVFARDSFDLPLADKLVREERKVVCNDFALSGDERIIVVSGPNQGGKTTFARAFGQLHYLAALGLTVPARDARLFLFDRLFTHFERQEDIETLRGKLKDDLVRIHDILEEATPRSVVVMNEIFNSTTTKDALFLSQRVIERIIDLDLIAVCVTFIDEVTRMSGTIVSMVSTVVPDNPAERTFRIERRPADGLAYAISVARKYRLTYDQLKKRIGA